MGDTEGAKLAAWFDKAEQVAAERGLVEFRSGRPVVVTSADGCIVGLPVDGLNEERLAFYRRLCAPVRPHLVVSAQRGRMLGIAAEGPLGLAIDDGVGAAAMLSLVAEAPVERNLAVVPAGPAVAAAIELAKLAKRLPALLIADVAAVGAASWRPPPIAVSADAVMQLRQAPISSLAIAAEANVPLNGGLSTRFVIFRDAIGGISVAVIVGAPDFVRPVGVRLHSACLTGDAFGSRRCDCGDQLRLALGRLYELGGGVILYLDQEGRGLGLANKMRAYRLQDAGFDTLDADTTLGFKDDERDYGVAAHMLQLLGCTQVLLLTNNPAKLEGLARAGIKAVGRIALQAPVNPDNRRYLTAKATRAGHKLDHLLADTAQDKSIGCDEALQGSTVSQSMFG